MSETEAGTCRKLVVPMLQQAGWDDPPHAINEQRTFTDGRIVFVGGKARHGRRKRAKYLLRYDGTWREIPDAEYHTPDFERRIALRVRTHAIARHLAEFMRQTDRFEKTIVFCVDQEHALEMRSALVELNPDLVRQHPDYVCRVTADEGDIGGTHRAPAGRRLRALQSHQHKETYMTTSTAFDDKASAALPRATYQDVLDAPEHRVAEIIDGTLYTHPRPAPRHATATSVLGNKLGPAFHGGDGGPGGWRILDEPELHLGEEILVPDLAGWRRERMPDLPDIAYFTLAPDWACEVLSASTRKVDLLHKRPIYAREGVPYLWLVDPVDRTLEAFELHGGQWLLIAAAQDDEAVSIRPFDAITFSLGDLWD